MEQFNNKVAVITGGASGIGLAIGRALVAEGARVVVADVDIDMAEKAAEALGNDSLAVACDVSKLEQVEQLADRAWAACGQVNLVFNNAGVIGLSAPLVDTETDNLNWILDVNLKGVWYGSKVFGKRFIEQGTPAHITNTGSEHSVGIPNPNLAAYTAAKHAVLGFSDVLREEMPDYIGVSIICPGVVNTHIGTAVNRRPQQYGGVDKHYEGGDLSVGMSPDKIAQATINGIKAGEFYIVTHPHVREYADIRHREISRAFDRQAPYFEGSEKYNPREIMKEKGL